MNNRPKFQCALVTGATSGLGEALSYFLASQKIPLIITGRNTERLASLKKELSRSVQVQAFSIDLKDPIQRAELIQEIQKSSPDLVINNAGLGYYGPVIENPTQDQMEIIDVNVSALTEITIEAAKSLKQQKKKGIILNISSASAFMAFPMLSIYAATKAYVNAFSQGLDDELSSFGIRVLCACPGQIATEFRFRSSRGKTRLRTPFTMTKEEAVKQLWMQIQKEKPVVIFNWAYRLQVFLVKFIPQKWLNPILKKMILEKILK